MPQHTANKTLGEDLSPAVPCPKALPPSHTASGDHPGVDCAEVGRRSLRTHTGWSGKRQKWLELWWVLFFINEPVGMCHSATELNRSCCSSRTTAPSRPRVLVLSVHGMGWDRPEGTCCTYQQTSQQLSSLAPASCVHLLWESLTVPHNHPGSWVSISLTACWPWWHSQSLFQLSLMIWRIFSGSNNQRTQGISSYFFFCSVINNNQFFLGKHVT